jgi:hypothetical protein
VYLLSLAADLQAAWHSRWNIVLIEKVINQNAKIVHSAPDFFYCFFAHAIAMLGTSRRTRLPTAGRVH